MRAQTPCVTIWRMVWEAQSPLTISSGRTDGVSDALLATDANGLPFIPASSMAGVLRSAVLAQFGAQSANDLFGYAAGQEGFASLVHISHGHIHNSKDQAVLGLVPDVSDPLLKPLLERKPYQRQRVRLNHRGVAADTGLFDRNVLPAGHRFSQEWVAWSDHVDNGHAKWLESLLQSGSLRVGGLTRSGMGMLRLVRAHQATFDLRETQDLARWCALSRALDSTQGLSAMTLTPQAPQGPVRQLQLTLQPEAGFRIGHGQASLQALDGEKLPNDLPFTEPQVKWAQGQGSLTFKQVVLPASSVKGALAHRVAFHANRLTGQWATAQRVGEFDKSVHSDTVRRLFGFANGDAQADGGRAGLVYLSDVHIAPDKVQAQSQMHNSIDRFTGGVRRGALFEEENLYAKDSKQPLLTLQVSIDCKRAQQVGVTAMDLQALELAVSDLCQGRLALGADGSSGLGFFNGQHQWDGDGQAPTFETAEVAA